VQIVLLWKRAVFYKIGMPIKVINIKNTRKPLSTSGETDMPNLSSSLINGLALMENFINL